MIVYNHVFGWILTFQNRGEQKCSIPSNLDQSWRSSTVICNKASTHRYKELCILIVYCKLPILYLAHLFRLGTRVGDDEGT